MPPSANGASPVADEEWSDARNGAARATSSACPARRSGMLPIMAPVMPLSCCADGPILLKIGVPIGPGLMVSTRIRRGASSAARVRPTGRGAALPAACTVRISPPADPAVEPVRIAESPSGSTGAACLSRRKAPRTLMLNWRSNAASSTASGGERTGRCRR